MCLEYTGNETWAWQLRSIKCAKTSVCFVKVTCSHSLKRGFIPERSPALSRMLKMMTPVRLSKYLNIPYALDRYNLTFLCVAELQISAANLRQKQQDPEHPGVSKTCFPVFRVLCAVPLRSLSAARPLRQLVSPPLVATRRRRVDRVVAMF